MHAIVQDCKQRKEKKKIVKIRVLYLERPKCKKTGTPCTSVLSFVEGKNTCKRHAFIFA